MHIHPPVVDCRAPANLQLKAWCSPLPLWNRLANQTQVLKLLYSALRIIPILLRLLLPKWIHFIQKQEQDDGRITAWPRLAETSGSIWPSLCSSRVTQSRGPRAMSRRLLEISKKEILLPLGNLYLHAVTCTAKKCSWCSGGASRAPVVPTASWPCIGHY